MPFGMRKDTLGYLYVACRLCGGAEGGQTKSYYRTGRRLAELGWSLDMDDTWRCKRCLATIVKAASKACSMGAHVTAKRRS